MIASWLLCEWIPGALGSFTVIKRPYLATPLTVQIVSKVQQKINYSQYVKVIMGAVFRYKTLLVHLLINPPISFKMNGKVGHGARSLKERRNWLDIVKAGYKETTLNHDRLPQGSTSPFGLLTSRWKGRVWGEFTIGFGNLIRFRNYEICWQRRMWRWSPIERCPFRPSECWRPLRKRACARPRDHCWLLLERVPQLPHRRAAYGPLSLALTNALTKTQNS